MMRLATYNVEWFANLFDKHNHLIEDHSWSGRHDVTKKQQINALGKVFQAIGADAVMIIEAPNTGTRQSSIVALENFARRFELRTSKAVMGFISHTNQEIALLYDPASMDALHDPKGKDPRRDGAADAPRFDGVFLVDLDIDGRPEDIVFSKPPLELSVRTANGTSLRMIGVHAKSKAPYNGRTEEEIEAAAIANRRKQLAQCIWIRQRVEEHLEARDNVIVLGDFNDGPGLDSYEELFGQSSIEIVQGISKPEGMRLREPNAEAARATRYGAHPTTARFYNVQSKSFLNAMLDYIMVSDGLFRQAGPVWKIWHPFDNPDCYQRADLCEALLTASDHFPVTLDLDI
jgi:hypothetical protein